jgi:hypothetical protein
MRGPNPIPKQFPVIEIGEFPVLEKVLKPVAHAEWQVNHEATEEVQRTGFFVPDMVGVHHNMYGFHVTLLTGARKGSRVGAPLRTLGAAFGFFRALVEILRDNPIDGIVDVDGRFTERGHELVKRAYEVATGRDLDA